MAERGIDNVTFADIARTAGQRNNSVVPYYFVDRTGLLRAILAKHTEPIGTRRSAMLEAIGDDATVRDYVRALVLPIAHEVQHGDGGDCFVRIAAHMLGHPEYAMDELGARHTPTTLRLERGLRRASKLSPSRYALRLDLVLTVLYHGLADHSRLLADEQTPPRERTRFLENLVDVIEAMLLPPVGDAR